MKTFVVAYINYFDNDLKTCQVTGDMEVMEALNKGLTVLGTTYEGKTGFEGCETLEQAKDLAFNSDQAVDVIEVMCS